MNKININFIIGVFALIAGVILCVQVLDVNIRIDFSILWWSFFTMVGVVIMINDRKISILPSIIMVIGIWFILKDVGIIHGSIFALIWPLILVVVGLNLMFSKNFFTRTAKKTDTNGMQVYNGIFGGVTERLQDKNFKGLIATALFGAVEIDLREIEVQDKEVYIDATAIFGGVTFIMPTNKYNVVEGEAMAIFGGNDNKFKGNYESERATIFVNSKSIFGGVEIK